jgi:hypothetical protein
MAAPMDTGDDGLPSGTWMSDGEEDDDHFEYYFDNERGPLCSTGSRLKGGFVLIGTN